jgi:hypothetical protein
MRSDEPTHGPPHVETGFKSHRHIEARSLDPLSSPPALPEVSPIPAREYSVTSPAASLAENGDCEKGSPSTLGKKAGQHPDR